MIGQSIHRLEDHRLISQWVAQVSPADNLMDPGIAGKTVLLTISCPACGFLGSPHAEDVSGESLRVDGGSYRGAF
jgi:hypothetical protein